MKFSYVKLKDLCKIQSGGTPRRGVEGYYDGSILWAKIGDIENAENGFIFQTKETITEAGLKSINNRLFPKDTVLLAMYGSVGKTSIVGTELATNQAILGLQPKDKDILDFRYLRYWLDFSKEKLVGKARGVALQNISATIVKEFEIPLPPIKEQLRIVEILESANTARQKRKASARLMDEYLRATFLTMFSSDNTLEQVTLGSLAKVHKGSMRTGPFGSDLKHSEFVESGVAVLGIDNAVKNKFSWDKRRFISAEKYEKLKRYTIFPRDVIVTIMGTTGRSAVIPDDIPLAINTKHLAAITFDETKANPYFMCYSLQADPRIMRQIQQRSKGAIMDGLNLTIIKSLEFSAWPIELQNKFEAIYHKAQNLKQAMVTQSKVMDTQFEALAQKAFNGSL
jgi:type I restriction enzyme S subunit